MVINTMDPNVLSTISSISSAVSAIAAVVVVFYTFKQLNLNKKQGKRDAILNVIGYYHMEAANLFDYIKKLGDSDVIDAMTLSQALAIMQSYCSNITSSKLFNKNPKQLSELNVRMGDLAKSYDDLAHADKKSVQAICFNIITILSVMRGYLLSL